MSKPKEYSIKVTAFRGRDTERQRCVEISKGSFNEYDFVNVPFVYLSVLIQQLQAAREYLTEVDDGEVFWVTEHD